MHVDKTCMASAMPPCRVADAMHVCSHCGAQHASRNALFRHLSERCDPAAKGGRTTARVAIAISYVGSGFHGASRSAEQDEAVRPTVAGAVLQAARLAWGHSGLRH